MIGSRNAGPETVHLLGTQGNSVSVVEMVGTIGPDELYGCQTTQTQMSRKETRQSKNHTSFLCLRFSLKVGPFGWFPVTPPSVLHQGAISLWRRTDNLSHYFSWYKLEARFPFSHQRCFLEINSALHRLSLIPPYLLEFPGQPPHAVVKLTLGKILRFQVGIGVHPHSCVTDNRDTAHLEHLNVFGRKHPVPCALAVPVSYTDMPPVLCIFTMMKRGSPVATRANRRDLQQVQGNIENDIPLPMLSGLDPYCY